MLKPLLTLLVLGVASRAAAERDTFFLGDGIDGSQTVETGQTQRVNTYARVREDLAPTNTVIRIDDVENDNFFNPGGFRKGQLVLVLQTQTENPGITTSINLDSPKPGERKEGRWELARLSDKVEPSGSQLTLASGLIQSYEANRTQVISVPEFVSLRNKGTITALPWDGNSKRGGVIAFLVQNTLVNDGEISASKAGFRGGQNSSPVLECIKAANRGEGLGAGFDDDQNHNPRLANAGGGGVCASLDGFSGGGGGGNSGVGGRGGNTAGGATTGGEGGAQLTQALHPGRLLLGGGGGTGYEGTGGGRGGGAIFIRAGSLVGGGSIVANGESVTTSSPKKGGGGGGGGGTIYLRVASSIDCSKPLEAKGGNGGSTSSDNTTYYGPGGGGGGGYIFLQAGNPCSGAAEGVSPGNPGSATISNGPSSPHGAQPGDIGLVKTPLVEGALQAPGSVTSLSLSDSVVARGTLFVKSTTPTITINAPEGRQVWLSIDGGDLVGPLTDLIDRGVYRDSEILDLSQGPHRVSARTEYQGLWGQPSAELVFTVDNEGPSAGFNPIPPAHTNSTSASFFFTFSSDNPSDVDSTVSFQYSLDGSTSWSNADKDVTITTGLAANRDHTLSVRALDLAGNIGAPASRTWNIDTIPPGTATVTRPTDGALLGNSSNPPAFQGKAEKNTDKVDVYVDNQRVANNLSVTGTDWNHLGGALSNGAHQVQVIVRDLAGNTKMSAPVYFFMDTNVPTVTIQSPAGGSLVRPTPLVVSGTTEPGSTVTLTLKKGSTDVTPAVRTALADSNGNWRYETSATLTDGSHTVTATATDRATNTGSPSGGISFIVDQTPPETTLTGCPANGYANASSLSFGYSATDANPTGMTYACAANVNSTTQSVSCSQAYTGYTADGTYTWLVRATDAASNTDLSPAFCRWVWDRTPPSDVTIINKPKPVTNEDYGIFAFSATDTTSGLANYRCSTDGVIYKDCFSPHVYPTPETKDYVLYVRARDRAGNDSVNTEIYRWTVNKGLPVAKLIPISGADNPTNAVTAVFRLEVEPRLPQNTIKFYYVINNPTVTDLKEFREVLPDGSTTDGSHAVNISIDVSNYSERMTIRAVALDETRKIQTPRDLQQSYEWNIDRAPPSVEIVSGPNAWERVPAVRFEFRAPGEGEVRGFRCTVSDCVLPPSESRDCTGTRSGAQAVFQLQEGVREGRNCISVRALDMADNESVQPAHYEWQLDTKAPEAPVIDAPQGSLTVNTRLPSVEGSAEPNVKVLLLLDDGTTPAAEAIANDQGHWVAYFGQAVADGSHNLKAIARDQAGNNSAEGGVVTLLVDGRSVARVIGGGLNCASTGGGGSWLALLAALAALHAGRRQSR